MDCVILDSGSAVLDFIANDNKNGQIIIISPEVLHVGNQSEFLVLIQKSELIGKIKIEELIQTMIRKIKQFVKLDAVSHERTLVYKRMSTTETYYVLFVYAPSLTERGLYDAIIKPLLTSI